MSGGHGEPFESGGLTFQPLGERLGRATHLVGWLGTIVREAQELTVLAARLQMAAQLDAPMDEQFLLDRLSKLEETATLTNSMYRQMYDRDPDNHPDGASSAGGDD